MALQDYKDEAKLIVRQSMDQGIVDEIKEIQRIRVSFKDDATLKAAGVVIIDAFDGAYDDYATQIQACADEAEVDVVMGSVSYPEV